MKALLLSLLLVADTAPRFADTYSKSQTRQMTRACKRWVKPVLAEKTGDFCKCYVGRIQDLVSSDEIPNLEPNIIAEVRRVAAEQCLEEVGVQ